MGVYIEGMELPDKNHLVLVEIDSNGDVFAAYDGGRTKLADYKAVPVPEHGRLIDADAVTLEGGPYYYDDWCKWALGQYQDAPTVIPADKE